MSDFFLLLYCFLASTSVCSLISISFLSICLTFETLPVAPRTSGQHNCAPLSVCPSVPPSFRPSVLPSEAPSIPTDLLSPLYPPWPLWPHQPSPPAHCLTWLMDHPSDPNHLSDPDHLSDPPLTPLSPLTPLTSSTLSSCSLSDPDHPTDPNLTLFLATVIFEIILTVFPQKVLNLKFSKWCGLWVQYLIHLGIPPYFISFKISIYNMQIFENLWKFWRKVSNVKFLLNMIQSGSHMPEMLKFLCMFG